MAVGLWLSALNVQYRDFRYTLPFLTQFWFFATPVVYPSSLVPEKWRLLYGLNPMAGVVDGFRWALLGKAEPPGPMLWVSVGQRGACSWSAGCSTSAAWSGRSRTWCDEGRRWATWSCGQTVWQTVPDRRHRRYRTLRESISEAAAAPLAIGCGARTPADAGAESHLGFARLIIRH